VVSTDAVTIKGNVLPSANVTYDLGTSTQRWKDLWLSNSTIYLGNAQISANATAVTITNPAGGNTVLQGATPSITGNTVSVSGNITGDNILAGGVISATGNITGGNVLGGANVNATTHTGTTVSVTANVTGGNLLTGGLINATGNITGGNVNTNQVVGTGLTLVSTGDLTLSATGNINVNNEYINNVPTPVADGDAVNKLYVDNFVTGLNVHDAVTAATPTTLATITSGTITYYNGPGSNGVGATLSTTGTFNLIDTVNVQTAGTRILVLNEANAVTNGVYVWSNATAITRASDYNTVPEVEAGDFMFVTNGATYGNTGWIQTSTVSNIGFAGNNITFTQFSGSGTYSAGTGLTLTGTTFSVNASQTQVTSVGTLGSLLVTGNVTGGNVLTGGLISSTGNITGGNLSGTSIVGTLTTASQTNITALGTLGSLTVTANTTSGNLLTGGVISATGNITGGNILGGANVNATTHTGTTVSVTANITGGNILTGGLISATGNITGGNLVLSGGIVDNTGNLDLQTSAANANINFTPNGSGNVYSNANVFVNGLISASGNITGGNIITGAGSGGNLTGANVISANTVTVTANITGGNILTGGIISATGNITGGNLRTAGLISATGTVTGSQFNGSGAGLTSIPGANVSGTVANATYATSAGSSTTASTVTTAAQPNITSVGTLSSVTISGVTSVGGAITRTAAGTGYLNGNYNSIETISTSGAIYSIGGSYVPLATSLNNMYGIGYGYSGQTANVGGSSGVPVNRWGMYVASAGVSRIFLDSDSSIVYAATFSGVSTTAKYADLAELYSADAEYPPGTVVDFGGTCEITLSVESGSNRIAGVVSTNPAHLMNSTLESTHTAAVALSGRVPTLVIGPVRKGDMMVSAGNGHAQACATPAMGTVIGKAVEDFVGASGTIEIAVGRL
jgi:hypothetical protein